ncbi:neuromedin U receptor [Branchiostoma belcheri]|nr:neuromedin U receptor [Branchiostoma belcheri]
MRSWACGSVSGKQASSERNYFPVGTSYSHQRDAANEAHAPRKRSITLVLRPRSDTQPAAMRHVNSTERGEPVYPTFGEAFLYDNSTAGTALPPGYNSTLFFTIPQVELVLLTAVYALIFVVGVVGNLLVGVVVAKVRRMRSPTNYLLLNLSVADLLVLLVCVPAAIQETWVVSPWLLGEFMCKYTTLFDQHGTSSVMVVIIVQC